MIPILEIYKIIFPIVFMALIGFLLGKFRKINLQTLADIIIYLSSPALIFTLLSRQPADFREIASIAAAVVFVIGGSALILFSSSKLFRFSLPPGGYLPILFMNSAFIGYPLAFFAFGESGLSKAIIYDVANGILFFTLGIFIISQGKERLQLLRLPFIYAALLGIIVSAANIAIPRYLYPPLTLVGETAIPLALIMLGCRLSALKISSWKFPLLASLLRIGLGASLGAAAALLLKTDAITSKVIILSSSLPSALTAVALSEEYGQDQDLVAAAIAVSTLLSVVTIPLILRFLLQLP